jgi:hypothetical protein
MGLPEWIPHSQICIDLDGRGNPVVLGSGAFGKVCTGNSGLGQSWSYLACRIGLLVPIWQPCRGSSFQ